MNRLFSLVGLLLALAAIAPTHSAAQPFHTGYLDNNAFYNTDAKTANGWMQNARKSGATFIRLNVHWSSIAPQKRPVGFKPSSPSSPGYDWALLDQSMRLMAKNGLTPILMVFEAPKWAEGPNRDPSLDEKAYPGVWKPNSNQFAAFGKALALRYSGKYPDSANPGASLPKARYLQAWNEPNLNYYLAPQSKNGKILSPGLYQPLLNKFYAAVKSVRPDVQVLSAGMAPLGSIDRVAVAPLQFLRTLTCLKRNLRPKGNCSRYMRADIYDQHLYTSGGPTHKAGGVDEVGLGDLPELRRTLRVADRYNRIKGKFKWTKLFSTEFSWDTVPDPGGLPMPLAKRWVAEALFRMWQSGITVMTWQGIVDQAYPDPGDEWLWQYTVQSGFFFYSANPNKAVKKGSYYAFRFPFVAFKTPRGIRIWGRTPNSKGGKIRIQQNYGSGWRRKIVVRADKSGIFSKTFRSRRQVGRLRAIYGNSYSVPFSLKRVPDRFVRPFGGLDD
ncbi:MAG TPA: hypothetical protein PLN08_07555 [Solirubrobacterales bacterium]|nr:hypothetical protein [Solirubrobacterales bacterium]